MDSDCRPRVFIEQDIIFGNDPLSAIVEQAGCEPVLGTGGAPGESLAGALPPLSLVILSVGADFSEATMSLAQIRNQDWLSAIPILGVAALDRADLDFWRLRALGVVGIVYTDAGAEHVRFRIGRVAYDGKDGRRFVRAPCRIPVKVDVGGVVSDADVTNLSVGGVGLVCQQKIEPNTQVSLTFSLDTNQEAIVISGRTVNLRPTDEAESAFDVGIFFFRLSEGLHERVNREVSRLLAAWDAAAGLDLVDPEDRAQTASAEAR
jgi:hypothetical protein